MRYFLKLMMCILPVILIVSQSNAQEQTKPAKIRLASSVNIAMLNGSRGTSPAIQAIIGGGYKNSFLGAGVGLDYYRFRSIPVFAHLSQTISKKTRGLLVYGELGYNYDWVTKRNRDQNIIDASSDFGGGVYYDLGIGYRIAVNKRDAFLLSTGYSYKKLTRKGGDVSCPFIGPCLSTPETYDYYLRRLVIKAGWWF